MSRINLSDFGSNGDLETCQCGNVAKGLKVDTWVPSNLSISPTPSLPISKSPDLKIFLLLCGIFSSSLQAQPAPTAFPTLAGPTLPLELQSLRAIHIEKSRSIHHDLDYYFAARLEALEKEAVQAGDYEQAIKARDRRYQILNPFGPYSAAVPGTIYLLAKTAKVSGTVGYDFQTDVLYGWKTAGHSANWSFMKIEPGEYSVRLHYAVADQNVEKNKLTGVLQTFPTGGSFHFYLESLDRGSNDLSGKTTSTGSWDTFQVMDLGSIKIKNTSATFKLEGTTSASGGLMNLKGIELIPKRSTEAEKEGEPAQLAALKASFTKTIEERKNSVLQSQALRLKKLAADYSEQGEKIIAEGLLKDAERLVSGEGPAGMDDPNKPSVASADNNPSASQGTPFAGGMQIFRNVTFVPDSESTGTTFRVKLNGLEYKVRLYLVESPPIARSTLEMLGYHRKYFGLNTHDVHVIGSAARQFTENYLNGRTFSLQTWGKKDSEGTYFVFLRLEGIGHFARVLVARGFAAINGLVQNYPELEGQQAYAEMLDSAQKKARESKQGAWGLAGADDDETSVMEKKAAPKPDDAPKPKDQ